jgi:septum formation protein
MVFMINNKIVQKKLTNTNIYFKNNNKKKIKNYVFKNFYQIKSAVGCYNLEGVGIDLFDNISLSYFNVLGLDIINFLKLMRKI